MNIKQAKQEIINTVKAYLKKDDTGAYEIPVERQRPILMIGPPGIGKTAIMEQVALECGINLVSYTITHHTRQSAIGLPFISHKNYGGREYAVTEYTMSEIIASVYDQIEASGISEGILFLDEINCVSETLAPTMLQFLQYKTFGPHRVPDGFLIVTAGNPPQYNRSVRDFDIVTLDRMKRIKIEEDYPAWKEYAYRIGIHGAVMAYLEIRRDHFYSIRTEIDDKYFVTARGWEDLSRILYVYEELGTTVTEDLIRQYLQDPVIAQAFSAYYDLYNKYRNVYRVPEILGGTAGADTTGIRTAPFDEKLSLLGLLIDALNQEFQTYAHDLAVQKILFSQLTELRGRLQGTDADAVSELTALQDQMRDRLTRQKTAKMISREEEKISRSALQIMADLIRELTLSRTGDSRQDFGLLKTRFQEMEAARQERIRETGDHLTNTFSYLSSVFGEGQEMVIFLSELAAGYYSLKFVSECGNDAYYRYNKLLLLRDRREQLQADVMDLLNL